MKDMGLNALLTKRDSVASSSIDESVDPDPADDTDDINP